MRRSEAARYARWSVAVALILASITAFVYLKRDWLRHIERKKAPPPTPVDVTRQSSGITFKKFDERNRAIFEVRASKSTDFKGQAASLLEEVQITIFGKSGDRHDVIHTHSCQYTQQDGGVACAGDVRFDLMSANDAKLVAQNPALAEARSTRVETSGVTFNRSTGTAQTDRRVTFAFPNGSGDAIGLEYQSEEGTLHLLHEVRLRLTQPPGLASKTETTTQEGKGARDVHVKGTSLDFARDSGLLHLLGPAEAVAATERLTAGEISLKLDEQFRAQTLVATAGPGGARPQVKSTGSLDRMNLDADTLTAHFAPEGWITKLDATGAVHGLRSGATESDEMDADSGTLGLWTRFNQPRELNLSGRVALKTKLEKTGDVRTLQTSALRMDFSGGQEHQPSRPLKAETLAPGVMEWTDSNTSSGGPSSPARTKLQADKLITDFADSGKARQLQALGNVQTDRWIPGHPVQTATATNGLAQMSADGGWSQMDMQGDVKLKEGERSGQADHARFERASQTATLTGHAVALDATTQTNAPRIIFVQHTDEIRAEGGVRSTDFSGKSSAVQLAPVPANITSDSLTANSKDGHAQYTGHARLWQGDSVLEANSIELLRNTRVLNAAGNVRAVFPQAPTPSADSPQLVKDHSIDVAPKPVNPFQAVPKKPQLWHAVCANLTYDDKDGHAHLTKDVIVQSADQKMRGPVLDLYFTRSQPTTPGNASSAGGAQQISRAVGTGGVVVEEGERKAIAERGEYTAVNGKFVMSGGNPTLYDGSAGTTTGLQLTFFLADDTIIVDSENGSRTLTKHRVQK